MQQFIDASIKAAEEQNVTGKNVTPFVLQDIFERTAGRSLATNIALVKNNAKLSAKIAAGLSA